MEATRSIDEMSGSELLDRVDDLARTQRRCEVEILKAAVQHAVIHNPETLDPGLTRLPGRERARRYGGLGTEAVAEFACAELGARLGVSPWSAHALIADALDLVVRLPRLWARVEALEVKASYARYVARQTRELSVEQAGEVDERVAEPADGRVPWSRFTELVAAAVTAADRWNAWDREHREARRQFAKPTRSTEHGMRGFYIRAPFPVITRLDATVQLLADLLATHGETGDGETDVGQDNDRRRVQAILLLANPAAALQLLTTAARQHQTTGAAGEDDGPDRTGPAPGADADVDWSRLLPAVQIFVHMYCGTPAAPSTGVARVEGLGPVTERWVRDHLSPEAKVTVRPVLDLAGQAPVDGYEVPDAHRVAVDLMSPADVFPYAANTSRGKQVDHTDPYDPHAPPGTGQSRIGNYGPMTRFHHRIKTHGHWQLKQPWPGIYLWRDPHGAYYLVDHTGTRRIGTAA